MANRVSALRAAADTGNWLLRDIGRELRVARIVGGKTLAEVARLIGKSASWVSRVERGRIAAIRMTDLTRHAAAVGLKPWIRLFPLGPRILDAPQLALLQRFLERIGHAWGIALEVPVGIAGDMRAADALLTNGSCRCMVEVITRLADFQAHSDRSAASNATSVRIGSSSSSLPARRTAGSSLRSAPPLPTSSRWAPARPSSASPREWILVGTAWCCSRCPVDVPSSGFAAGARICEARQRPARSLAADANGDHGRCSRRKGPPSTGHPFSVACITCKSADPLDRGDLQGPAFALGHG